ncbi:MAG: hypothetical protein HY064_15930 [Bacteroidetes bacterium]|nr:hypothetical protein [Bacteroidota bacterium]
MKTREIIESFDRISRCIRSSRSLPQLATAERIVDLFRKQHSNPELSEKLYYIFIEKANELHYFEWKDCA